MTEAIQVIAIVAVAILGIVAIYFGRGLHVKAGDLNLHIAEPTPQPSTAMLVPRQTPKPRKPNARGKKSLQKRKQR